MNDDKTQENKKNTRGEEIEFFLVKVIFTNACQVSIVD